MGKQNPEAFLSAIKKVVEEFGKTFSDCADAFDEKDNTQRMTFDETEEALVDSIVRTFRDRHLNSPINESEDDNDDRFVYEVHKSFISSHRYWGLDFTLSLRYSMTEDSQP